MKDDLHGPGQRAPERADKLGQDGEDSLPVGVSVSLSVGGGADGADGAGSLF